MPALGESVTEGTVTRWLKQVGDTIEVDEPLLEVSTDKVDTEIPSPVAGTVLEIKVQEDETADVGAELAIIGTPVASAGSAPAPAPEQAAASSGQQQQAPAPQQAARSAAAIESAPAPDLAPAGESYADPTPEAEAAEDPAPPSARRPPAPGSGARPPRRSKSNGAGDAGYVTPLVRKLAADKGVDLSTLTGTGVGGRIRKQDVIEAADKAAAAKAEAAKPRPGRAGTRRGAVRAQAGRRARCVAAPRS